jgi:hypothetical protein
MTTTEMTVAVAEHLEGAPLREVGEAGFGTVDSVRSSSEQAAAGARSPAGAALLALLVLLPLLAAFPATVVVGAGVVWALVVAVRNLETAHHH